MKGSSQETFSHEELEVQMRVTLPLTTSWMMQPPMRSPVVDEWVERNPPRVEDEVRVRFLVRRVVGEVSSMESLPSAASLSGCFSFLMM